MSWHPVQVSLIAANNDAKTSRVWKLSTDASLIICTQIWLAIDDWKCNFGHDLVHDTSANKFFSFDHEMPWSLICSTNYACNFQLVDVQKGEYRHRLRRHHWSQFRCHVWQAFVVIWLVVPTRTFLFLNSIAGQNDAIALIIIGSPDLGRMHKGVISLI